MNDDGSVLLVSDGHGYERSQKVVPLLQFRYVKDVLGSSPAEPWKAHGPDPTSPCALVYVLSADHLFPANGFNDIAS